jgi:hypothetical protein
MQVASFQFTIGIEALTTTDIDSLAVAINNSATEYIELQSRGFFAHLNEVCEAAGTSVKNIGQGVPTIAQMRELLRRMDLEFDEHGMLKGLRLIVHPSQLERAKQIMKEAEGDAECVRIVLEKRAEWLKNRAAYTDRALSR